MIRIILPFVLLVAAADAQTPVDRYNVVWNSPSKDSSGSMPLGNGDIGLNVWTEPSGDVVFYVSKTDSWAENTRLLKLGRVRVRLLPNPYAPGEEFTQTLKLSTGEILITQGRAANAARLTIWVDANQPVIRVTAETRRPTEVQVFYERWRDQQRILDGQEAQSAYGLDGGPEPIVSSGDSLQQDTENRIIWYHRNGKSAFPSIMKLQGLQDFGFPDPLLNRTFGAGMQGEGFVNMNATALHSKSPGVKQTVSIYALTSIADSSEAWVSELLKQMARIGSMEIDSLRTAHEKWWGEFWNRSWIRVNGGSDQQKVSQGYALQRFINACAGRGQYPIKFNGSIFTVDGREGETLFDADYRRWGGAYWFQNTRLIYWPMLASGDTDLMQPFFRMYREAEPLGTRRTKLYFNHDGLFFPETMYFWGAYANSNYGWKRDGKLPSFVENPFIRNYYSGSLELLTLMLDYYSYTQDKTFLRNYVGPIADGVITFYDKHYERDGDGKLRLAPAQSLETWQDVINPLPDIAGLRFVLNQIVSQKMQISKQSLAAAKRLLQQLPDLPVKQSNGKTVLQAAEKIFGEPKNTENPELYAVFPYRIFGVDKPDLELGRATFEQRRIKRTGGWPTDAVQAAYLGLNKIAKDDVVQNFSAANPDNRFPAFWGPNYDWVPDQDHGNVAAMALQTMLMQSESGKIILFPSWPKEWDVEFKLHAPNNTTVEGVYKSGKLEQFTVIPEKRAADVMKMEPQ